MGWRMADEWLGCYQMAADDSTNTTQDARVRLRPETQPKWRAIAEARRWTLSETADALADEFIDRHQIPVPDLSAAPATNGASSSLPQPPGPEGPAGGSRPSSIPPPLPDGLIDRRAG